MKQARKPITIVKIIAVAAIIVLALVLILPTFRTVYITTDDHKVRGQLHHIKRTLEEYQHHHGYYPQMPDPTALTVGFLDDPNNWKAIPKFADKIPSEHIWTGRYGTDWVMDGKLLDPFDGHFWYLCPGKMNPEAYDLWSTGPDGGHGDGGGDPKNAMNRFDNDDVTNWKGDFDE